MGVFISNRQIDCNFCGFPSVRGKENSSKKTNGELYVECRWICPRCGNLIRLDDKIVPSQKKDV